EATEAAECEAEVVVRFGPVGAKAYRLVEGVDGLREERVLFGVVFRAGLREVAEGRAEVEVSGGHVRNLRDERLERVNRLTVLPRVVVDPGEVDVGLRVVGAQADGSLKRVRRLRPTLLAPQRVAEPLVQVFVVGVQTRGVAERGGGVGETAQLKI